MLEKTPAGRKHIDTKWVFKSKEDETGNVIKFKVRWVFKGYMQAHGVDYDLIHVPVSRISTLRTVLSISVKLNLKIDQMDVTTAFLNAALEDEIIFVRKPPGYENLVPKGKSIRLLKSLYGLKQASRMCNITIDTFLKDQCGMNPIDTYACLYTRHKGKYLELIIIIYVDDILLLTRNDDTFRKANHELNSRFDMKYMGNV